MHANAPIRFAVPPGLGPDASQRASQLEHYLTTTLSKPVSVSVPASYEQLAKELLSGKVDVAWVPPFICARIEAMGVRVMVRGVRAGASTYRAALVCQASSNVKLESLVGTSAVWPDRDSVAGYLLPMAFLREKGMDPAKTFHKQGIVGSYRKALEAVAAGEYDVTSVFAPSAKAGLGDVTGIAEIWPEKAAAFRVVAFTDESPNDGIAGSMNAPQPLLAEVEKVLVGMHQDSAGQVVMRECFHIEKFEVAPRMGYRALYRVALASL